MDKLKSGYAWLQENARFWKTIVATVIALALLAWIALPQIGVIFNKTVLLSVGAVLGYYIDRAAFPYARPGDIKEGTVYIGAMIRRAIIMAAVILAIALGA